jgi:transposase-like protein
MKIKLGRLCLSLLLGITYLMMTISGVEAARADRVATRLTIEPLQPLVIGERGNITVHLTNMAGEWVGAVANEVLYLFVDDVQERRIRTDDSGTGIFPIRDDLALGKHSIRVVYPGSSGLVESSATAVLEVVPAQVEIYTIPPVSNVVFSLAGRTFKSDTAGVARIAVPVRGTYTLEVLETPGEDTDTSAKFSRWDDEVFTPYRDIQVPLAAPIGAGFEISHQVRQTFVDLFDKPVDPERITSLTIKGSNGIVYKFADGQPRWLPAGRVVRRAFGLEETKILYSVVDVTVDGSNVVSQAQQKFYVDPNDLWQIQLMLYSAEFNARDAFFHFPIGKGIRLEYPDGHTKEFLFGSKNTITVNSLARGLYHVTVIGASGMAPPTPLAMSRDQTVELIVLSRLDMEIALGFGVCLALGLLFFGRPHLLQLLISLPGLVISKVRVWKPRYVTIIKVAEVPTLAPTQCPSCFSATKQVRAGFNDSGSQRFRCRVCGKVYTPAPHLLGYPVEMRQRVLQLYLEGNSRRAIARSLNISRQTVSRWIAAHTLKLPLSMAQKQTEMKEPSSFTQRGADLGPVEEHNK